MVDLVNATVDDLVLLLLRSPARPLYLFLFTLRARKTSKLDAAVPAPLLLLFDAHGVRRTAYTNKRTPASGLLTSMQHVLDPSISKMDLGTPGLRMKGA